MINIRSVKSILDSLFRVLTHMPEHEKYNMKNIVFIISIVATLFTDPIFNIPFADDFIANPACGQVRKWIILLLQNFNPYPDTSANPPPNSTA